MNNDDKLARLVETVRSITDLEKAPPWGNLWDHKAAQTRNINMFTYPNPISGTGRAPFVISPDVNFYARLFGYSLKDVFTDARAWTCFTLEQTIWNYYNLHHDNRALKKIIINQLGFFVPSFFGMMPIYSDDAVPRIPDSIIDSRADFNKLKAADFYTSGLSPLAHQMYEETRDLLPDDFSVEFPTWITGPFGTVYHLRGALNLAMDLLKDPLFVHEMMAFVIGCMKKWLSERTRFLGLNELEPIMIGNDEVGVPMISPSMYEEFVLPYEIELSEYFGGVDYWHSCSNITPLLPMIARIPNLRMIDVGPRTKLQPAVSLFGKRPGSSIMKRINPVSEILEADEDQIRNRLLEIKATCFDVSYMLFFSGILPLESVDNCRKKILQLDRICHEIFHNNPARPVGPPEPVT